MAEPRLVAMALVAILLLVPPAVAEGSSQPQPPPGGGNGGGCGSTNCTTGPPDNSTSPGPGSGVQQAAADAVAAVVRTGPGGTCDVARPTGDRPSVSVNPVLGLVTVNPGCVLRWLRTGHLASVTLSPQLHPA